SSLRRHSHTEAPIASLMMEVPRITLIVAVIWTSPLTVSSQMWATSPGVTCNPTCPSFFPLYECRQIVSPITQNGVCLPDVDSRGCCSGCLTGLIDASTGIGNILTTVTGAINGITIFDTTEQGLIDQVLTDLVGIEQFGNMENILNNVDNQIVPNLCTWGQTFATKLWRIKDDIELVLGLIDGRGGTLEPIERGSLQTVINFVHWFKKCLLPRLLEVSGLECFK
ncbi:unnamed protein product, partial [Owenia fusiformis]